MSLYGPHKLAAEFTANGAAILPRGRRGAAPPLEKGPTQPGLPAAAPPEEAETSLRLLPPRRTGMGSRGSPLPALGQPDRPKLSSSRFRAGAPAGLAQGGAAGPAPRADGGCSRRGARSPRCGYSAVAGVSRLRDQTFSRRLRQRESTGVLRSLLTPLVHSTTVL